MAQNNQQGEQRRAGMNPRDQSLDRGYGGLPGKDAGVTLDDEDTVTKTPAKDRVRAGEQREETKH